MNLWFSLFRPLSYGFTLYIHLEPLFKEEAEKKTIANGNPPGWHALLKEENLFHNNLSQLFITASELNV